MFVIEDTSLSVGVFVYPQLINTQCFQIYLKYFCSMESYVAFIDESGGHGFNFSSEGTSTHFVVNAILTDAGKLEELSTEFEKIKKQHFPDSELKSSKIGNRDVLRLEILNKLNALNFKFYYLIVDKTKIHLTSGLQFKESFYKFLYGILYNNIYRHFKYLTIVADELISNEFISSFEKYIKENHQADLFHQNNISFTKSNETVLLQLTDFIGGTLNRFYSGKSTLNPVQVLAGKCIGKLTWPNEYVPYTIDEDSVTEEFQEEISNIGLLRIDDYISRNIDVKEHIVFLRVMFLTYLRSIFVYNSKQRYVFTHELIRHIKENTGEDIKEQFLRQQIVGPLRSEGILIMSNSNGYKIPSTKKDIIVFFNLFSKIINPMIHRLEKTHSALFTATQGKLNMMDYPEFEYLKKLLEK
jgi:hypothetical protein